MTADGTVPHKRCVTQWLHDCNATEIDRHDTSLQLPRFELVLYKSCTAVARWSIRRHITVVTTALRNPRKSTCGPTGLDGVKVPQIGCISTGRVHFQGWVYFQGRVPFHRSGAFPRSGVFPQGGCISKVGSLSTGQVPFHRSGALPDAEPNNKFYSSEQI